VVLSSLAVRHRRQFGACWLASQLWQELKLDEFFAEARQDRSATRAEKERAIRLHVLRGPRKDLTKLAKTVRSRRVQKRDLILKRLGRFRRTLAHGLALFKRSRTNRHRFVWSWDRRKLRNAWLQQGAYRLRTNLTKADPAQLWRHYYPTNRSAKRSLAPGFVSSPELICQIRLVRRSLCK